MQRPPQLSAALIDTIHRESPALSPLGVVTAVDWSLNSLTIDQSPGTPEAPALITGVRWFTNTYEPSTGDFVGLIKIGTSWWVLGTNSSDPRDADIVYGEAHATPTSLWQANYSNESDSWAWSTRTTYGEIGTRNGSGMDIARYDTNYWVLAQYSAASLEIPSGATIVGASIATRATVTEGQNHNAFVAGHAHTTRPTGAPSFFEGEDTDFWPEIRPMDHRITISSPIALGLAAGTTKGIAITAGDYGITQISPPTLTINYTLPV